MADGLAPVEYMLKVLRDETADPKDRAWAAEKAAPYVHARLAPLERTVEIELPSTATLEGIDQALDRIIAAMGSGQMSPSEGGSFISVIEARRRAIETSEVVKRIEALEAAQPKSR
jgi:hypothetical protein